MKQIILLLILFTLMVVFQNGWKYLCKYRHSKGLKVGVDSFKLPQLNLSGLYSEVQLTINISIVNFSNCNLQIEQLTVYPFSPSGKLLAEQIEPLFHSKQIEANQNNILPLTFLISPTIFKQLIQEAGGLTNVGATYLTAGNYGIPIHLKGFVIAQGVSIDLDEKIII